MASFSRTLPEDEIIRRFSERIRYDSLHCLFVRGDKADHLLETDVVQVHPHISPLAISHARNRLGIEPGFDGTFLCVVLDIRNDVPVELCVFTTGAIHWWEEDIRKPCRVEFSDMENVLPQCSDARRGLKISRRKIPGAAMITLSLHDALLKALAGFLLSLQQMEKPPALDVNSASAEELARLPMMTDEKARGIVARREELNGFTRLGQIGDLLKMHPNEFMVFSEHVTLRPAPRKRGRRVDL